MIEGVRNQETDDRIQKLTVSVFSHFDTIDLKITN